MLNIRHLPTGYGFDKKDVNIMNFMIEKSKNVDSPFKLIKLYKEYDTTGISKRKRSSEMVRAAKTFRNRIARLRSKLQLVKSLDIDAKVKMIFALSAPIDIRFLTELRKGANVEVDNLNRITKYEKNGGGLHLAGTHLIRKCTLDTLERDKQMMKFLAEKCKIINTPMAVMDFTKQFKVSTHCKLTISQLCARYKLIREQIYNSTEFDKPTKIKMMFISSTAVPENILKELRKDATVEIDKKKRIVKYTANDGSLKLQGDHSVAAKNQAKLAETTRKIHSTDTSEDEDEEERDEEIEEEESDEEEEEAEDTVKISTTITKSGRMPKHQSSNIDYSSDSDDDEFGESASAKNESSTGSTSTVSRFNLQKRKNADDSSTFESSSKIAKPGKVDDIQNNKNSVRKNRENQEDDLIYDGPGEPSLPIPFPIKTERKNIYESIHEQNEYKPDRSQLSNLRHYSEESIIDGLDFENPQVLINNPLEGIMKSEDTETPDIICDTPFAPVASSTSGSDAFYNTMNRNESRSLVSSKAFLKALLSLTTLNAPMLEKLRVKIEKAIEKLGKEDQKISADYILMSLNSGLHMMTKSASLAPSQQDSTSLKEFLLHLRISLFFLNSPVFDDFQEKLEDTIKEIGEQDKNVPIEKIRSALNHTLDIVIP